MWKRRIAIAAWWGAALAVLASLAAGHWRMYHQEAAALPGQATLASLMPGVDHGRHHAHPVPHFTLEGPDGAVVGIAFQSDQVPPVVRGYGGEMRLLAAFDLAGVLHRVLPLKHDETLSYFRQVERSGLLEAFSGHALRDDLPLPDTVSGATMTARALAQDTLRSGRVVAREVRGLAMPPDDGGASFPLADTILALVTAVAALASARFGGRWGRTLARALSFVVFGLVLNVAVSLEVFRSLLAGRLPAALYGPLAVLVVAALGGSLLHRRSYCRFICPFGVAQDAAFRAVPWRLNASTSLQKSLSVLPNAVLVCSIVLIFGAGLPALAGQEPFTRWMAPGEVAGLWWWFGLLALASALIPRFYCRFICPTGALLMLVQRGARRLWRRP